MSLDITNLFKDMANNAAAVLQNEGAGVGGDILKVLQNNKTSIAELIEAKVNGDIDQDDFESELAREKLVLEAELLMSEIMARSAVQKAMNAAMDTLTSALKAAI